MAAPGTKDKERFDSTSKQTLEYWDITTHPAGVQIQSALHKIIRAHATWSEYIGTEPSSLQVVIGSTGKTATVYATGGVIKTAHVTLVGDP